MSIKAFFVKLHKWTAVAVGVQVLLWVAGGLVMSAFDIDAVRGEATKAVPARTPLALDRILQPASIAARLSVPAGELSLLRTPIGTEYRVVDTQGRAHRFDAHTGERLPPISAAQARAIARAHYVGGGQPQPAIQLNRPSTEYRGRLPAWRVDFDDEAATTLYVAADDGELIARRNRLWRIYDVAWMLHIMDYREREDFNHPLLVAAAALALMLVISGFYLVATTSWAREFRLLRRRR